MKTWNMRQIMQWNTRMALKEGCKIKPQIRDTYVSISFPRNSVYITFVNGTNKMKIIP